MEVGEFGITQRRDDPWVTTRIVGINRIGEELVAQGFAQHPFGGSRCTLHFVVDDAFVGQFAGLVELVAPAFLT